MKTLILSTILFFATTAIFAQVSYRDKNDTPPTTIISTDSAKVERKVENLNIELQKKQSSSSISTENKSTTPAERKKKARPGSGMYTIETEK